jgi:hypothetical protein
MRLAQKLPIAARILQAFFTEVAYLSPSGSLTNLLT